MLTIEIGRKSVNRITAKDGHEVLRLVERWLNDGGVPTFLINVPQDELKSARDAQIADEAKVDL